MGKNILKRAVGILIIPAVCFIAANILCAAFDTRLFQGGLSVSTFTYGLAYLSLVAFAVSINLHSGRFDFSVSSIIILSSTVVIMLACAGVDSMLVLLLAGIVTGAAAGALSGGLYLALRLPPMITSLGVALLLEAVAYIIAGGSESNSVVTLQPDISNRMKMFISANGGSPLWLALILATTLALMILIFHYTKFGYEYLALQSGQKIAVKNGAKEYTNAFLCYVIAGMLAGAAGMLFGCQIQYTRVSGYLNFGTVSKMFDAFCPLFFSGLVGRYCNKQAAIVISVVGYEFLQLAFGNINAVDTTFTSTVYGIINSVILVVFLIYLNNENKVVELVKLKKFRGAQRQTAK